MKRTDLYHYIETIWFINLVLLIFNILPIYPLDGGKILYSLLWFVLGRARSLMVATVIGFVGIAGLVICDLRHFTPEWHLAWRSAFSFS